MSTTVAIFLGHNLHNLPTSDLYHRIGADSVRAVLLQHRATILAEGSTEGHWEGQEEPGTVFLCTVPSSAIPQLRTDLFELRKALGQDALGVLIHDHSTYGESYL